MAAEQPLPKAQLEAERDRILRELASVQAESPIYSASAYSEDGGIRTSTSADAIRTAEFEKSLALERNLRQLLGEVEHALEKIAVGTYGRCDRCGEPIAPARLEALSHAALCVSCKSQERQTKGRPQRR